MLRTICAALAVLAACLTAAPAAAAPPEVEALMPNAQRIGAAHYQVLAISLARAELYAPQSIFSWERPFALVLNHQRAQSSAALADRAIREMRQRGAGSARELAPLRARLSRCLSDVTDGDRVTAVSTSANSARFFHNGAPRCTVEWPGFRRHFFGIWLAGRDGLAARLSAQLRGEG